MPGMSQSSLSSQAPTCIGHDELNCWLSHTVHICVKVLEIQNLIKGPTKGSLN